MGEEFAGQVQDIHQTWNGNRVDLAFTARGMKITGLAKADPSALHLEVSLPFLARPFKDKIAEAMRKAGRDLLAGSVEPV